MMFLLLASDVPGYMLQFGSCCCCCLLLGAFCTFEETVNGIVKLQMLRWKPYQIMKRMQFSPLTILIDSTPMKLGTAEGKLTADPWAGCLCENWFFGVICRRTNKDLTDCENTVSLFLLWARSPPSSTRWLIANHNGYYCRNRWHALLVRQVKVILFLSILTELYGEDDVCIAVRYRRCSNVALLSIIMPNLKLCDFYCFQIFAKISRMSS